MGGETDPVEGFARTPPGLLTLVPPDLDPGQGEIGENGLAREEAERREDHADLGPQSGRRLPLLREGLPSMTISPGSTAQAVDGPCGASTWPSRAAR
ncbi:hypothetical protein GPZ77_28145 [Streptomyces sp. QHH-9511]|nr:hypothetical protein GPZ77_28145 [Streptomyces sp. QHH-9511]